MPKLFAIGFNICERFVRYDIGISITHCYQQAIVKFYNMLMYFFLGCISKETHFTRAW